MVKRFTGSLLLILTLFLLIGLSQPGTSGTHSATTAPDFLETHMPSR